jgi:hypothetical protein
MERKKSLQMFITLTVFEIDIQLFSALGETMQRLIKTNGNRNDKKSRRV